MSESLLDTLNADQRRTLENVRAAAERIWSRPLHCYYTDHTVTHSDRVVALLDGLTGGMMATGKRLTPGEAFVMRCEKCGAPRLKNDDFVCEYCDTPYAPGGPSPLET